MVNVGELLKKLVSYHETDWLMKSNGHTGADIGYSARNEDNDAEVSFVVGSGGINRGIWDKTLGRWMIHSDSNYTYVADQGVGARLWGLNDAADNTLTLSTTDKNALSGQSYGALISQSTNGTSDATTKSNDYFTVTPSAGSITVKKRGLYLIVWNVYFYTGFTDGDNVYARVYKNDSSTGLMWMRNKLSGNYHHVNGTYVEHGAANTKYTLMVHNSTAARGAVSRSPSTRLEVIKLG